MNEEVETSCFSAVNNNDETVTVSGTTNRGTSVNVTVGTAAAVSVPVTAGAFTYTTGILAPAVYPVSVTAVVGAETSAAVTASATVVAVAPTVSSVQNVNGNQLVVTFSEPVDNATTFGNYTLRNVATGTQVTLTNASIFAMNGDQTEVTITLDQTTITDVIGVDELNTLDNITLNFNKAVVSADLALNNNVKVQYSTNAGTSWTDLFTVTNANTTIPVLATTVNSIPLTLFDQAAIDLMNAQRGTANVTYRAQIKDGAVTDGTYQNEVGGSTLQAADFTYNKETVAPSIVSVEYYKAVDADADISANSLYITYDQKLNTTLPVSGLFLSH